MHHQFLKVQKNSGVWQSILREFRNLLLESKSTKLHDSFMPHDPVMKLRAFCLIVLLK